MSVIRGVVAGLVGGAIATGSMSLVHKGIAGIRAGAGQQQPSPDQDQDEDPTVKVAEGIVRWLGDHPLPEAKKPLAGNLELVMHLVYGVVTELIRRAARHAL